MRDRVYYQTGQNHKNYQTTKEVRITRTTELPNRLESLELLNYQVG